VQGFGSSSISCGSGSRVSNICGSGSRALFCQKIGVFYLKKVRYRNLRTLDKGQNADPDPGTQKYADPDPGTSKTWIQIWIPNPAPVYRIGTDSYTIWI